MYKCTLTLSYSLQETATQSAAMSESPAQTSNTHTFHVSFMCLSEGLSLGEAFLYPSYTQFKHINDFDPLPSYDNEHPGWLTVTATHVSPKVWTDWILPYNSWPKAEPERFYDATRHACSGVGITTIGMVCVTHDTHLYHRIIRRTVWGDFSKDTLPDGKRSAEVSIHDLNITEWIAVVERILAPPEHGMPEWQEVLRFIVRRLAKLCLRRDAKAFRYILSQLRTRLVQLLTDVYEDRGVLPVMSEYIKEYKLAMVLYEQAWLRVTREAHMPQMCRLVRPPVTEPGTQVVCNICLNGFSVCHDVEEACENPIQLPCGCAGIFERACITTWVVAQGTCPFCRCNFDELLDIQNLKPYEITEGDYITIFETVLLHTGFT